jgi:hypothetical protein
LQSRRLQHSETKATGTDFSRQQPGGDTPGVAVAPVALAGVIVPGVATFIVTLSAHADVFGVGITAIVGSMLVPPNSVIIGCIAPSGGLAEISGVESGKSAPLVGGPPGVELHTVLDELPRGDAGDMVPVALPTIVVGMVPKGLAGIIAVGRVVVVDDNIVAVVPGMDVGTVLSPVDGVGPDDAVIEGGGRGGSAGGCGAGMVVPK